MINTIAIESSGLVDNVRFGHLKITCLNSSIYFNNGFDSLGNFRRGITVAQFDKKNEYIITYKTFDTHSDSNESVNLISYLKTVNRNTLCAFAVVDECTLHLSKESVKYLNEQFGLDLSKLFFRSSYVGLATKYNKTVFFESTGTDIIKNKYSFFSPTNNDTDDTDNVNVQLINTTGLINNDILSWNNIKKQFGVSQIVFQDHEDTLKPNFIIALTGQSNSQGWNAFYDENNVNDQNDDRIFGWNATTSEWEKADMLTESLGQFFYRKKGWQSLAFHFAKCLVEGYPNIRPGIINLGVGGQSISRWVKYNEGETWYDFNKSRSVNGNQGDIFDLHVNMINNAMENIKELKSNIDVICWHQGESDGYYIDPIYYLDSLNKVINQYRQLLLCTNTTPFIVGETTGAEYGSNKGWEARNIELRSLNRDSDVFTKCIYSSDLPHGVDDLIHFSAEGQRKMGSRYFRAFRSMFDKI